MLDGTEIDKEYLVKIPNVPDFSEIGMTVEDVTKAFQRFGKGIEEAAKSFGKLGDVAYVAGVRIEHYGSQFLPVLPWWWWIPPTAIWCIILGSAAAATLLGVT